MCVAIVTFTPRKGFDASWSRPSPQRAKAVGYQFVCRYLSRDPSKNLTKSEADAYHAAGIDIALNWETTINASLQGFAQGVADAQEANRQADAIGASPDKCIYYSTDTMASAGQVRGYYQGAKSINRRPVGGYGGSIPLLPLLNEGTIRYWWQANAGYWSGYNTPNFPSHPQAHIRQFVTPTLPNPGGSIDENIQLKEDAGLWLSPTSTILISVQPKPPIRKRTKTMLVQASNGGVYYLSGGFATHVTHPQDVSGFLSALGQPNLVPISDDTLNNFTVQSKS